MESTDTPQPSAPFDDASVDLSRGRILIVDDNLQNLELLQAYLEDLDCPLLTAGDGIEALGIIDRDDIDLVLLDVMMPRMSGFEVCKKIKSDPATRDISILMVTALNEVGDIERGVECGTDDFLSKPVKKLELLTRVKSLLRVRLLKRELDRTREALNEKNEPDSLSGDV